MKNFDIVIIGNSAAGLQAVRTIRRHDKNVSVALVDREACPAYSRVLTPYYIGGKTGRDNLFIVDGEFYLKNGVETFLGHSVEELDPDRCRIGLSDGTQLGFRSLLLATGAEARPPEHAGPRICTLRHLADADKISSLLDQAKSIVAVGAGLVSVPFLSHAGPSRSRHLVIGSNRVFSRVVDPEASEVLEERLVRCGVILHKNDDATAFSGDDTLRVALKSGKELSADLVLMGKGVVPNTKLGSSAGLDVNDGIVIDSHCRTSHPAIYAAGDAAEGEDLITGAHTVQGNWMTAVEQGEVAALNMLGIPCRYEGSLKNNITEIFGSDVAAIGSCTGEAPHALSANDPLTGRFRKIFLDDRKRVIGAVLIGETNDAGVWYQHVKTRASFPGNRALRGTNTQADLVRRRG